MSLEYSVMIGRNGNRHKTKSIYAIAISFDMSNQYINLLLSCKFQLDPIRIHIYVET